MPTSTASAGILWRLLRRYRCLWRSVCTRFARVFGGLELHINSKYTAAAAALILPPPLTLAIGPPILVVPL